MLVVFLIFVCLCIASQADTYNNGSKKSSCSFYLEEPIRKRLEALQMTCSVLQFTVPNSIYNINSTNNIFDMSETINNISIHYHLLIPHGNFNVNTFIKQFIISLTFYSSNFELTFNPITGKFYLKNKNLNPNVSTIFQI